MYVVDPDHGSGEGLVPFFLSAIKATYNFSIITIEIKKLIKLIIFLPKYLP